MMLYPALYNRLKNQHEAIGEIIRELPDSLIAFQPSPGKWSIHDHIAHLAKYQPVFTGRISTILRQNSPVFERYKAENDPEFESWRRRGIQDLLNTMAGDRKIILDLLENLRAPDLMRPGFHPKYGMLSLWQWAEFFILHEAHHIFTIFQLAHDQDLQQPTGMNP